MQRYEENRRLAILFSEPPVSFSQSAPTAGTAGTATRAETAARVRRETDAGAAADSGIDIACTVEDAGAAADGNAALQCGL